MPTPDSDIDDQLRAAMKVLDDEAPSGYFDTLPNLTLARLEGSTMQQGTSGTTTKPTTSPPPVAATPPSQTENTEDSGLHDIRNLAQSTKQRLSSKRITTSPPVDDVASSSAGWKAVALPQPAKMVALPELAELPSKKEVKAAEKAAAKVQKTAEVAADHAMARPALEVPAAAPARQAFALPSAAKQPKKSKGPLIALVGIGVAAAAGAAIFVTTQKSSDKAPAIAAATHTAAPAAVPPTTMAAGAGSAEVSADVQKAQDDVAKAQAEADAMRAQLAAQAPADKPATETKAPAKATPISKKGHGKVEQTETKPEETKQTTPPVDTAKPDKKNADGSEPDFNDLLKEAGVDQTKHEAKPKLDKKSLTGDDFKNGMAAVTSKAQGCYKGTQGTATVKLEIAPSGKIAKIAVTGAFTGKPEATCVAAAVRGATFPAWDGRPMSFTYPILLSE
jgi:hypothetical protein